MWIEVNTSVPRIKPRPKLVYNKTLQKTFLFSFSLSLHSQVFLLHC